MTNDLQDASLELTVLTPNDEPQFERLVAEVGWGVPKGRLRMMLEMGEGVGYLANGQLVATSILFPFGPNLAFLGMVIVHPERQRQGLGNVVVRKCLDRAADLSIHSVGLLATDAGYPLYQKLGFVTADKAHRFVGKPIWVGQHDSDFHTTARSALDDPAQYGRSTLSVAPTALSITQLDEQDWPDVLAFDTEVSGADRSVTYRHFVQTVSYTAIARGSDARLCGYGMATKVGDLLIIGPLQAVDMEAARQLAVYLMRHADGEVRLDVPSNQTAWMRQLEEWGLVATHVSPMMLHGGITFPGCRQWLYGIMDAALG